MSAVVVTGLGVCTGAGPGLDALLRALGQGPDLRREVTAFPTEGLRVRHAVLCDDPGGEGAGRADRVAGLALDEALDALPPSDRAEAALWLGGASSSLPEAEAEYLSVPGARRGAWDARIFVGEPPGAAAERLARSRGLGGPVRTVATACSSGLNAIGAAFRAVRAGRVAAAVAGGVEVLGRLTLTGFHALGLLSADALRPFDRDRAGIVLGEGAGFLVLEPEERARARGAPILGRVRGYACGAEAWHPTQPDPSGATAARVMRLALEDAGLGPEDLGWIKAHGNGTLPSDRAEARAISSLLGDRRIPVTSMKGLLGHTLAASGAIEAAAALAFTAREGALPPIWGLLLPDPECDLDLCVPGGPLRSARGPFLVNAFAFGGNDACLVLEARP